MKKYIVLAFVITFLSGCTDTPVTIKNKLIDKDFADKCAMRIVDPEGYCSGYSYKSPMNWNGSLAVGEQVYGYVDGSKIYTYDDKTDKIISSNIKSKDCNVKVEKQKFKLKIPSYYLGGEYYIFMLGRNGQSYKCDDDLIVYKSGTHGYSDEYDIKGNGISLSKNEVINSVKRYKIYLNKKRKRHFTKHLDRITNAKYVVDEKNYFLIIENGKYEEFYFHPLLLTDDYDNYPLFELTGLGEKNVNQSYVPGYRKVNLNSVKNCGDELPCMERCIFQTNNTTNEYAMEKYMRNREYTEIQHKCLKIYDSSNDTFIVNFRIENKSYPLSFETYNSGKGFRYKNRLPLDSTGIKQIKRIVERMTYFKTPHPGEKIDKLNKNFKNFIKYMKSKSLKLLKDRKSDLKTYLDAFFVDHKELAWTFSVLRNSNKVKLDKDLHDQVEESIEQMFKQCPKKLYESLPPEYVKYNIFKIQNPEYIQFLPDDLNKKMEKLANSKEVADGTLETNRCLMKEIRKLEDM